MIAGRYRPQREVGRGGMGAVWLAEDTVLGRQVAVKRVGMVPGGVSPDLERAEREARLAARLNHPHVVAVFDLVADDDGQWLVMEYVEGVTLAGLVQRDGVLTPEEASPLLWQAADALAAAHAAGIVHRDVKPSNILVTRDGQVKLSDFGIARAEADASLTQTGLVTGSPAYLAPEVASGQAATDASDVWSLGATLFHALAGHPPYEVGDNLMGALYRIVHEDPPRLDDAGSLAPLLGATMTREPADRWSMAQVRDFLAADPDGVTIHPAPTSAPEESPATQVMEPSALTARTEAPPEEPVSGDGGRSRRGWLPLAVLAGLLVVLVLVAWRLLAGGETPPPPAANTSPSQEASRSGSGEPTPRPNAGDMEAFIGNYLATAPSSPEKTFMQLTPAFQETSGGFEGYSGFWSQIDSAELVDVRADPEAMTVAYTVHYVKNDGEESDDDVVLQLEFRDGRYLIAAES